MNSPLIPQTKDCHCCTAYPPLLLGLLGFFGRQVFLAFLGSRRRELPPIHGSRWCRGESRLVPAQLIVPLLITKPACELIYRGLFWRETTLKEANPPEPNRCAVCFSFEALLCILGKFRNNWVQQSQCGFKSARLFDEEEFLPWSGCRGNEEYGIFFCVMFFLTKRSKQGIKATSFPEKLKFSAA